MSWHPFKTSCLVVDFDPQSCNFHFFSSYPNPPNPTLSSSDSFISRPTLDHTTTPTAAMEMFGMAVTSVLGGWDPNRVSALGLKLTRKKLELLKKASQELKDAISKGDMQRIKAQMAALEELQSDFDKMVHELEEAQVCPLPPFSLTIR